MGLKDRPYVMWLKDWHHRTKDWPHLTKQKIIVHHVMYIQCTHRWYKVVRVNGLISAVHRFLVMQRICTCIDIYSANKMQYAKGALYARRIRYNTFLLQKLEHTKTFFLLTIWAILFFRCILSLMSILYISNQHINNYLYTENHL